MNAATDVVGMIDAGGVSKGSVAYSPWGERRASSGEKTLLGFQGDITDSSSALVDMTTRNYDPVLGRFITRDVVFGEPSSPLSLNQFAYGTGNPVTMLDPTGMIPQGLSSDPISICNYYGSCQKPVNNGGGNSNGGGCLDAISCGGGYTNFDPKSTVPDQLKPVLKTLVVKLKIPRVQAKKFVLQHEAQIRRCLLDDDGCKETEMAELAYDLGVTMGRGGGRLVPKPRRWPDVPTRGPDGPSGTHVGVNLAESGAPATVTSGHVEL